MKNDSNPIAEEASHELLEKALSYARVRLQQIVFPHLGLDEYLIQRSSEELRVAACKYAAAVQTRGKR